MAASVQSMCHYWKNFDLQELQKELDLTATELANRQDESDTSRKRLVEQSRDFKKNTPEDIRKIVAPLLKSFQSEVDALSKRSKASEAAFLSVYKKLIDLPDPVPCLEVAIQFQKKAQKVQDFEIENKQLRDTLNEYNHEFAEVKNQEVTIKQLREKLKDYEDRLESTAEGRAKEKEKELQRQFADKERQLQESQLGIAKKLGEAEQKIASLQHTLDGAQSELFDVRAKNDESTTAKSDEVDMLLGELDRANERATAAEREVEHLSRQLASATQNLSQAEEMQNAPDMEQAIDILKRSSLEVELAAKEKEISQLVEDVQRLQASINKLRETSESQILKLEEELMSKSKAFANLEDKMRNQGDYEELKRELNILKSVEFQRSDEEEEVRGKSLEMLLLEKNKALQSENTQLKVTSKDVSGPHSTSSRNSLEDLPAEEPQRKSSRAKLSSSKTNKTNHVRSSPVLNGNHSYMGSPLHNSQVFALQGHQELVTRLNGPKLDQNNPVGLETSIVAKTVRELLSIHNLGQRLFAKHILGLSQGTVSELLSKPKSWDKLTEKGRESYRKMYLWASDERNIMALKELSPRKGSQPLVPTVKQDSATEERIAQILNDAKHAMQYKKGKNTSAAEQAMQDQQLSPAMVASLYHQEMMKMASGADSPDGISLNSSIPAHRSMHVSTNHSRRSKESRIRSPSSQGRREREAHVNNRQNEEEQNAQEMVARIYRAELSKLAQAAEKAGNVAASSMYQQELARIAQNAHVKHHFNSHESSVQSRVKAEPVDRNYDTASDTNDMPQDLSKHSRRSSDESTSTSRHAGSAFKLVHPRLNGQDTPEPSYTTPVPSDSVSPLQRMQNIANSLMSRNTPPSANAKPLKAVLPPIAQEQFDKYSNVNTEDLVKKVKETLSQYSISQRLFGENVLGLSQGSVSDLLARPKPWHMLTQKGREPFIRMQIFLEDAEAIPKLVATQYRIPPDKLMRNDSAPPTPTTEGPMSPPSESLHAVARQPSATPTSQQDPLFDAAICGHYFGFYTNSIFEIAAMTPDLDTVDLTSKIKDILQFHNLGQKLFGEAVLGLSQGSVSELLSKPKPWSVLSIKGKEPFVRMLLWLNDPYNIEKLKLYQTEAKANRRRKSSVDEQRSCETPIKRPRVFFTEEQKETLRTAYANDPYPNQNTIEALASGLNVGVKTVVNWFHNHRMRAKQQQHTSGGSNSNSYDYNPMSVKSEPGEDNSNLSDGQSTPGDTSAFRQGSSGSTEENCQWLFPRFEPVQNSGDEDSLRLDLSKYGGEKEEVVGKMEDVLPQTSVPISQSGVKKRKSSQPKRVYEGTHLEKSHYGSTGKGGNLDASKASIDEDIATVNNNNDETSDDAQDYPDTSESMDHGDSEDPVENLERLRRAAEAHGKECWKGSADGKSRCDKLSDTLTHEESKRDGEKQEC